jgi:hypothetical protein
MRRLLRTTVPLAVIAVYRLLPPPRTRRFGGSPSSHLAAASILGGGNGWAALWRYGLSSVYNPKKDWPA